MGGPDPEGQADGAEYDRNVYPLERPCSAPRGLRHHGGLDLGRFLDLVAAEGMHAIVRPGPYICAEWDNGGLPAWLFDRGAAAIRADDRVYMAAVSQYFEQLAPILVSPSGGRRRTGHPDPD